MQSRVSRSLYTLLSVSTMFRSRIIGILSLCISLIKAFRGKRGQNKLHHSNLHVLGCLLGTKNTVLVDFSCTKLALKVMMISVSLKFGIWQRFLSCRKHFIKLINFHHFCVINTVQDPNFVTVIDKPIYLSVAPKTLYLPHCFDCVVDSKCPQSVKKLVFTRRNSELRDLLLTSSFRAVQSHQRYLYDKTKSIMSQDKEENEGQFQS